MPFGTQEILAIVVGASFAAGLNVYATVATLGLLARFGVLPLPPSLHLLTNDWTIGAAALLFAVEFVADKIPAFDLLWNALQTFVRVPVAALLAFAAASQLPPKAQIASALQGAAVALAAHGSKLAVRSAGSSSDRRFHQRIPTWSDSFLAKPSFSSFSPACPAISRRGPSCWPPSCSTCRTLRCASASSARSNTPAMIWLTP